jgi:hypothetical protein
MPPAQVKRGQRRASSSAATRAASANPKKSHPQITVELQDLAAANPTCCILIHGDNGVGKTSLAGGATASKKAGLVAFCSTERGAISAKRTGSKAKFWPAPDWENTEAMLDWADSHMFENDWLIMDSVTKMQVLQQRYILKDEFEMRGADIDTMQIQHWPKWQTMFMRFIDRMVDSNYNSILVCSSVDGNDKDGEPEIVPAILDTKRSNLAAYVRAQPDEVYYLGIRSRANEEPTRKLLTQYVPPWFAKSRYDIFERTIEIEDGDFGTMGWIIDELMTAREEAGLGKGE